MGCALARASVLDSARCVDIPLDARRSLKAWDEGGQAQAQVWGTKRPGRDRRVYQD
jgi:hypothetical protein